MTGYSDRYSISKNIELFLSGLKNDLSSYKSIRCRHKKRKYSKKNISLSDPAEARTQDPQIKSLLLYQLSYGVVFFGWQIYNQKIKMTTFLLIRCKYIKSEG